MFNVPEVAKVCAYQAAQKYGVPYGEMLGILHTEGGGYNVIDYDSNGTEDLGWAQINTCHLPYLRQFGITRAVLLTRPCINIDVGAWVLRKSYDVTHNWFAAAEGYNAGVHNLPGGYNYATKVFAAWHRYARNPGYTNYAVNWRSVSSRPSPKPRVVRVSLRQYARSHFLVLSSRS